MTSPELKPHASCPNIGARSIPCALNLLAVCIGRFAARSFVDGTRKKSRMSVGQRRNGNRYPNPLKGFNSTSANDVRLMERRSPIAAPVPATPMANRPRFHSMKTDELTGIFLA